ncbi:MAG TPA: TetR/AcrR family transcriptional regulator [Phycisphaerae bacterium]|nr:TetR/AcrR family transcriptional regulator [Phycisphaerae bacterium]
MTQALGDRKADIHKAACSLFRKHGYAGTSVRQIAEQVGILGGSLYTHMDSKDELLWEILDAAADRFITTLREVCDSQLGVMQKLRRAIVSHIGVITSDLDVAAIYTFEWRHLSDPRRKEFTRRRDEYERMFRGLVDQAIHERFIAAESAASATLFILSALNWVSTWYRPDGPMGSEEVAKMLADYIFDGLRRRAG